MVTTTRLLTADDLLHLPDDGNRYELVRGVLITMPPPDYEHGREAVRLSRRLGTYVEDHGLGDVLVESGYRIERDPDTVLAPDVSFVSAGRVPPPEQRSRYFQGGPDLAIEIASPSDRPRRVEEKLQDYFSAGTRLVWRVDRRTRSITVFRPDGSVEVVPDDGTITGEDVIPGFTMRVGDLFS